MATKITVAYPKTNKSVTREMVRSTISLHLMRYIIVNNSNENFALLPQRGESTEYNPLYLPTVENYTPKASVLRTGYVYVHYDKRKQGEGEQKEDGDSRNKLFKELKVTANGLINIESDITSEDIREPKQGEKAVQSVSIYKSDIVWVAYSEFQWSADYVRKVRTDSKLRERRMQKFDANNWVNDQGDADLYNIEQIDAYFPEDEKGKTNERTDAKNWDKLCKRISKEEEENPDTYDNAFFCLHDPLACADELNTVLRYEWEKMDALVMTIQTGIDRNTVLKEIVQGDKEPKDFVSISELREAEKMHKSLLLLYQTGFSSPENIKKYGSNLDKKRIEQLLGKTEREAQRKEISKVKIRLVNFLQDKYYTASIDEYMYQLDEEKMAGKARKINHMGLLQYKANAKDYVYILADENRALGTLSDKGVDLIEKELNSRQGILFEPANIELKQDFDTMNKILLTWNTIKNGLDTFVQERPKYITTNVDMLNEIRVFRNGQMIVDKCFETNSLKNIVGRTPFPVDKLSDGLKMVNISEELLTNTKFMQTLNGDNVQIQQTTLTQEFEKAFKREGKLYDFANKLENSKAWGTFVAGMSVLNLASAYVQLTTNKDSKTSLDKAKDLVTITSALAAVAETGATSILLRKGSIKVLGREISESLLKGIATHACTVGVFAGAVVDAIDSGVNFYKGDNDAAFAQGLAAVCGTLAGIGMIAGWNPAGWAALLAAGAIFAIGAIFLEDSALEELSKNCQFRQDKFLFWNDDDLDIDGTLEEVIKHHLDNGHNMISGGFDKKYKTYCDLYKELSDILFGGSVLTKSNPDMVNYQGHGVSGEQTFMKKQLYINIQFNMAKMSVIDPDLQVYLYPYGFKAGASRVPLKKYTGTYDKEKEGVFIVTQNDPQLDYFVALIDIPVKHHHLPKQKQHRSQAEILVLCRCEDNAHAFPIDDENGKPRYIAIREKLVKKSNYTRPTDNVYNQKLNAKNEADRMRRISDSVFTGDAIKRGNKSDLLLPSTWEK